MTVIKKMIAERNTHRNKDKYDAHDNTHNNKATKPAVEAEKQTGLVECFSNSNVHDSNDFF